MTIAATALPRSVMKSLGEGGGVEAGARTSLPFPKGPADFWPRTGPHKGLPDHLLHQHRVHGLLIEQRVFADHLLQVHEGRQLCQDVP